jgi:superfamily II DNA/RNA helicase
MFSATFSDDTKENIQAYVGDFVACLSASDEALKLAGLKHFNILLTKDEKIQFVADVFGKLEMTSTIIFVNKKETAYKVQEKLEQMGIRV